MADGKRTGWLAAVVAVLLAGCISTGRAPDVPLVPVPPLPLGRAESVGTGPPESVPPPTNATVTRSSPTSPTAKDLHQAAQKGLSKLDSYIVRLTRREAVAGIAHPEEVILFRFRERPWSVYLKWLGREGNGREVLYVRGKHGDRIHTVLASGDVPFVPAGRRLALAPDSALVKTAARHPITEAGLAASVERIGRLAAAEGKGKVVVLGPLTRPEFERPVYALEHTLPPGADKTLEQGGKRTYYFHPENGLPMLVTAQDEADREVEYYRYDRLQAGVKLDDADFDPESLWGKR